MVRFLQKKENQDEPGSDFSERLVTLSDPGGIAAEAYRTLRTSLLYTLIDTPPKVIVLTSPGMGEGKSTTCANLAVVLSQAGKSTLVMDCDLRKPMMHKIFGLRNFYGLVNALVGDEDLPETWWQEPVSGLKVSPTGSVPPNPAELLGSKRFGRLLAHAREQFDYVLVDAPPVGLVSDPAILATQADGVLLVLNAQNTRKAALRQSVRSLESVGANILGTVMNSMKDEKGGYYRYAYKSNYGQS